MNAALRLRSLTLDDLAFADALRAQEGWNQTLTDWKRFLAMAPEGCFLAEWEGEPAGTATTTVYGPELAWVGMVLVNVRFRGRGIGHALLECCLGHLRGRGVRCIKLDATPKGKAVYETLGFREEWTLQRWERAGRSDPDRRAASGSGESALSPADAAETAAFDARIFGVERRTLLDALAPAGPAMVNRNRAGAIDGFGMLRRGARAAYLGPSTVSNATAGAELVEKLLGVPEAAGPLTFWDVPDCNRAAVACARTHGFQPQRPLTRMFLGDNAHPGVPEQVWALAGPEVG